MLIPGETTYKTIQLVGVEWFYCLYPPIFFNY